MTDDLTRALIPGNDGRARAGVRPGAKPDQVLETRLSDFRSEGEEHFSIADVGIPLHLMDRQIEALRTEDIGIPLYTDCRASESIRIEDVGIPLWLVSQQTEVYSTSISLQ